ncbi:MAG TPA: hypothetical protein VJV03_17685 [Pyrinomonadaceae bacterium]|nr:hypothetical protein [Pyrinomonadaceae bacterium]
MFGCIVLLFFLSFGGAAQVVPLPRVGTIKDYPATGLMTGCGNLYFYRSSQATPADGSTYVFISRGDGSNAWMNLSGRDVRLRQIRSSANRSRFEYRSGDLRISVVIEPFKPENASVAEADPMMRMRITLRRGRAMKVIRAVGDSDC